jgi:hypothetical protein
MLIYRVIPPRDADFVQRIENPAGNIRHEALLGSSVGVFASERPLRRAFAAAAALTNAHTTAVDLKLLLALVRAFAAAAAAAAALTTAVRGQPTPRSSFDGEGLLSDVRAAVLFFCSSMKTSRIALFGAFRAFAAFTNPPS